MVKSEVSREQLLSSRIKRMWRGIVHHGLFLYTLRNLLARLGIDFHPYWIEREGLTFCKKPIIISNPQDFRISSLSIAELKSLAVKMAWLNKAVNRYEGGNYIVIGLYKNDTLAAFTMAQFKQFEFKGKNFKLKSNEAYLENMYTFEGFRGKNLAPYLRYKCYQHLANEGKDQYYSITQYFNKSSLKFKAKLNAEHQELWLHVGLFKRYGRNYMIKRYK